MVGSCGVTWVTIDARRDSRIVLDGTPQTEGRCSFHRWILVCMMSNCMFPGYLGPSCRWSTGNRCETTGFLRLLGLNVWQFRTGLAVTTPKTMVVVGNCNVLVALSWWSLASDAFEWFGQVGWVVARPSTRNACSIARSIRFAISRCSYWPYTPTVWDREWYEQHVMYCGSRVDALHVLVNHPTRSYTRDYLGSCTNSDVGWLYRARREKKVNWISMRHGFEFL